MYEKRYPVAIHTEGLRKRFGTTEALRGLDLTVAAGTIYGLLGPNGAGKSTTVRILATLLRPDGGRAAVLGHDVVREAAAVRRRIALAGQAATVDEDLTGQENLCSSAGCPACPAAAPDPVPPGCWRPSSLPPTAAGR
jgi:ABC-2 type transport system ATP-binding protein